MTETKTIHRALNDAKSAIGAVRKTERNQQQGFNFRGIDAVVTAAAPALNHEGIITVPQLQDYTYEVTEVGKNKTPMGHVMVKVAYRFIGPAGDWIESVVLAESFDSGDKACAKAMSVAYRIALLQTLNLPTDEADPDSVSYERSAREEAPKSSSTARTSIPSSSVRSSRPASSSAPQSADPVLPNPDLPGIVKAINAAKTADELNKVWKQAGELGVLTTKHDGKTIQQLMYDRGDAIKSSKSS